MNIRVLYFARLRETFGLGEETLALPPEVADVGTLLDWLRRRGGVWAEQLAEGRAWRVAVNQEMAGADAPLAEHAEVAIFPPVTGG